MNPVRDKKYRHVPGGRRVDALRPRLVQKLVEGKTSHELGWKVKVIIEKKQEQQKGVRESCVECVQARMGGMRACPQALRTTVKMNDNV